MFGRCKHVVYQSLLDREGIARKDDSRGRGVASDQRSIWAGTSWRTRDHQVEPALRNGKRWAYAAAFGHLPSSTAERFEG